MKKSISSLMQVFLAVVVLLLQIAGSSPDLHGWLHGLGEVAACSHDEGSCDPVPADPDEERCSDTCAVLLLAGGMILVQALEPEPVKQKPLSGHAVWAQPYWQPGSRCEMGARAPPFLVQDS